MKANGGHTGGIDRRTGIWGRPQKKWETLSEAKIRVGDLAQVVEHLPHNCKAMSSNPRTRKIIANEYVI
jgi:hypothetical protein